MAISPNLKLAVFLGVSIPIGSGGGSCPAATALDVLPSAVTTASGRFTIEDVPPGRHRVAAWHPTQRQASAEVVVPPNGVGRVEIVFHARPAPSPRLRSARSSNIVFRADAAVPSVPMEVAIRR